MSEDLEQRRFAEANAAQFDGQTTGETSGKTFADVNSALFDRKSAQANAPVPPAWDPLDPAPNVDQQMIDTRQESGDALAAYNDEVDQVKADLATVEDTPQETNYGELEGTLYSRIMRGNRNDQSVFTAMYGEDGINLYFQSIEAADDQRAAALTEPELLPTYAKAREQGLDPAYLALMAHKYRHETYGVDIERFIAEQPLSEEQAYEYFRFIEGELFVNDKEDDKLYRGERWLDTGRGFFRGVGNVFNKTEVGITQAFSSTGQLLGDRGGRAFGFATSPQDMSPEQLQFVEERLNIADPDTKNTIFLSRRDWDLIEEEFGINEYDAGFLNPNNWGEAWQTTTAFGNFAELVGEEAIWMIPSFRVARAIQGVGRARTATNNLSRVLRGRTAAVAGASGAANVLTQFDKDDDILISEFVVGLLGRGDAEQLEGEMYTLTDNELYRNLIHYAEGAFLGGVAEQIANGIVAIRAGRKTSKLADHAEKFGEMGTAVIRTRQAQAAAEMTDADAVIARMKPEAPETAASKIVDDALESMDDIGGPGGAQVTAGRAKITQTFASITNKMRLNIADGATDFTRGFTRAENQFFESFGFRAMRPKEKMEEYLAAVDNANAAFYTMASKYLFKSESEVAWMSDVVRGLNDSVGEGTAMYVKSTGSPLSPSQILADSITINTLDDQMAKLLAKANKATAEDEVAEAMSQFAELSRMKDLVAARKTMDASIAGRTLRAVRTANDEARKLAVRRIAKRKEYKKAGMSNADIEKRLDLELPDGTKVILDQANNMVENFGRQGLKVVQDNYGDLVNAVATYRSANLLLSITTQSLNTASGVWQTLTNPIIRFAGSAVRRIGANVSKGVTPVSGTFLTDISELALTYGYMIKGIGNSFKNAAKAFRLNEPITIRYDRLDSENIRKEAFADFASQKMTASVKGAGIAGVRLLNAYAATNFRIMTALDEFFSSLNYNSYLNARAMTGNLREDLVNTLTTQGIKAREIDVIMDRVDAIPKAMEKRGVVSDYLAKRGKSTIQKEATSYAQQSTFVGQAHKGTLVYAIEQGKRNNKVFKILTDAIMPFLASPGRIFDQMLDLTPVVGQARVKLNTGFSTRWSDLTEVEKSLTIGRQAVGIMGAIGAYTLWEDGRLFGNNKGNIKSRSMYSEKQLWGTIRVGDRVLNLDTYGSFGVYLNVLADMFESHAYHDRENSPQHKALFSSVVAGSRALMDTSFTAGLTKLIADIENASAGGSSTETSVASVMSTFLRPMILAVSLQSQVQDLATPGDGYVLEARSTYDRVTKYTFLARTLAPRYDTLGRVTFLRNNKANRFGGSVLHEDPVHDELLRVSARFDKDMAVPRNPRGFAEISDLRKFQMEDGEYITTAYNIYARLRGEVTIDGKNFEQALSDLFETPGYQAAKEEELRQNLGGTGIQSPTYLRIKEVLDAYDKLAAFKLYDMIAEQRPDIIEFGRMENRVNILSGDGNITEDQQADLDEALDFTVGFDPSALDPE